MTSTITDALTEVRTLDEIRALPHKTVLLHPVGLAVQVNEQAEDHGRGTQVVSRAWIGWVTVPTTKRARGESCWADDEFLAQWLHCAGPGAAYRVLHMGSRPWEEGGR